jgi:hypothetical protein
LIDEEKSRTFEMGQYRHPRVDPPVALFQVWYHIGVLLAVIFDLHDDFL